MVKLFVAVTDRAWFEFLSREPREEVNFWQPSGSANFRALAPGELFLFKLHAPDNFIVGGGVFSHASAVPLSMAWEALGQTNGVSDLPAMRERIVRYRRRTGEVLTNRSDPIIGCRILVQPFFWPAEAWLPIPESWKPNIVTGRGYDTEDTEGRLLWEAVTARLEAFAAPLRIRREGKPHLVTPRLGQGAFRLAVTDGYGRRCAVSGERTLPILDAAHIKAYSAGGDHQRENGLLLRTDIHRLFDLGYVTVSPDLRFEVGQRLKADFDNGKHYYDLHGAPIRPPESHFPMPANDALAWHREHRFLG
jgi:putative restriction endonuclease